MLAVAQRAVPALGVIHGPRALVWIHALRALVLIPLAVQAQASLLLLAYSPCAERERREREAQQMALIRELLVFPLGSSAERFRRAVWFLCAERSRCATWRPALTREWLDDLSERWSSCEMSCGISSRCEGQSQFELWPLVLTRVPPAWRLRSSVHSHDSEPHLWRLPRPRP